jgi:hypothetical protein
MLRAMTRGVRLSLVGSLVLVALAGCGRSWLAEREPWRREAELACLKSGAVKEGPAVTQMPAISRGVCGADFPLKVAALGDAPALGYAGSPRPPGEIPRVSASRLPPLLRDPPVGREPVSSSAPVSAPLPQSPGAPLILHPPGMAVDDEEEVDDAAPAPAGTPQAAPPWRSRPAATPVPLAPSRAPPLQVGATEITPPATLACPIVSALDSWMAQGVQPAALRWFGQPVIELKQISAYSCRGMNGQPGAKISEHAFGNALDIAAFTLADGRKVSVREGWRGAPEEQGFLRDVHAAACERFSTVLGPGSNAFHYDHLHVDLMRRASGRAICNPEAVPGEAIAARAASRGLARNGVPRFERGAAADNRPDYEERWDRRNDPFGVRRPSDPGVTGSVGRRRSTPPDGRLPRAIPGED